MTDFTWDKLGAPKIVDRRTFQVELDALQAREKAHTREGDAIAAARRRLPHGRGGPHHHVDWPARPGDAPRGVRVPPTADRLRASVSQAHSN
jgi:hypothetical protein